MELVELAPVVYACLQEDRGLGTSNSGLVNRGGGLVVDTFWDLPHTRELIDDLRAGVGRTRRDASSTRITTATTAGATSSSPAPRSSATALCAETFGNEQPEHDAGAARRHGEQRPGDRRSRARRSPTGTSAASS